MAVPVAVSVAVVVVAAGSGTRLGAVVDGVPVNKVLLPLTTSTVLGHSVAAALAVPGLTHLVVVVRPADEDAVRATVQPLLADSPGREVVLVPGGPTRHDSEWRALQALAAPIDDGEVDVVVVHDAARPLASPDLWTAVVASAAEHGGAIPAASLPGVLTADLRPVAGSTDDSTDGAPGELVGVQTPQAFAAAPLLAAHRAASEDSFAGTDTASVFSRWTAAHEPALRVVAVPSDAANLKVTFVEDVAVATTVLGRRIG